MTFPEYYLSTEPCPYGMFPCEQAHRFVSLAETVRRIMVEDTKFGPVGGMINPYRKQRPNVPRHFDEEV